MASGRGRLSSLDLLPKEADVIVSWAAGELHLAWSVDGFWSAFWGGLIISVVSLIINASFGKRGTEHR